MDEVREFAAIFVPLAQGALVALGRPVRALLLKHVRSLAPIAAQTLPAQRQPRQAAAGAPLRRSLGRASPNVAAFLLLLADLGSQAHLELGFGCSLAIRTWTRAHSNSVTGPPSAPPVVDLSFSGPIDEADRLGLVENLEASGLSVGERGDFLGKGGGPEVQTWVGVYLRGAVEGAGALTVAALVAMFREAWKAWRSRRESDHDDLPGVSVAIGPATYVLPTEGEDRALEAIPAHYFRPDRPNGDLLWDPVHGWEDVIELWARRRKEEDREAPSEGRTQQGG